MIRGAMAMVAFAGLLTMSAARAQTISDPLAGGTNDQWTIRQQDETPGLEWSSNPAHPGLRFNTPGAAAAVRPVDIGTGPFRLAWEVEIDQGYKADWRYPGVVVGLTSAPPDQQKEEDLSILIGAHRAGVAATVLSGRIYEPNRNTTGHPPLMSNFVHRFASPRGVLNAGGGGGHFITQAWPTKNVSGTRMRMELTRDAQSQLTFRIYHADVPAGLGPWVERQYTLPDKLASIPLTHLVIQKVMNPGDHKDLSKDPGRHDQMSGWVCNVQLGPADEGAWPTVAEVSGPAVLEGGSRVTLRGQGFKPGASVTVGQKPASDVQVNGGNELSFRVPTSLQTGPHAVVVANPDGLTSNRDVNLVLGRWVERIIPREADLAGGQVTIVGGGFDPQTSVRIDGQPVDVVERDGSTRLRIKVPAGPKGPAKVEVTSGEKSFAGDALFGYGQHPGLHFTRDELASLRQRFNDPAWADYKTVLLRNAEGKGQADAKARRGAMEDLLWAYVLSGERKYFDELMPLVDEEVKAIDHDEFRIMAGESLALIYDMLLPELTERRAAAMEDYLDRVIGMYNERIKAGDWWYANNPSNTICIGAAGGGSAAMALMNSTPAAQEAIKNAVGAVKGRYGAILPDGGNMEGTLYWNYGQTAYHRFAHMLKNTTGSDEGLLSAKGLNEQANFVKVNLGGDDSFFAFNDTQPWLTGWAICADLGSRNDDPLMLWMADHMAQKFAAGKGPLKENVRSDVAPYAFLWRGTKPAPSTFPGVPTVAKLDIMNWGVMRSEGTQQPRFVVGVKGQDGPLAHHAQQDLGSFVVQIDAQPVLLDPGYNRPKATDHTLPLIDGQGPGNGHKKEKSLITQMSESGDVRTMTIDSTSAYKNVQRVHRLLVLVGDEALVVLDDVQPSGPGTITAQYQAAWETAIKESGRAAEIATPAGPVRLQTFGPTLSLTSEPRPWEKKDWVLIESDQKWHAISGTYSSTEGPLVTVITRPGAGEVSAQREGDQLTVALPSGRRISFARENDGWKQVKE